MLLALAFSAATLLAQSSQQVKQPADTDVEFRQAVRQLAIEQPDVAREYEHLTAEPLASRRHLFAALPSSMKSAVWMHHLLLAVTTHPEFTAEQQSVIYDAIRLLSQALYEGPATGRKDVHDLTLRAQRLFPGDVALSLFVEIGSAIPIAAASQAGCELRRDSTSDQRALPKRDAKAQPPVRAMAMDCDCSVWSDWCANRLGSGWSCHLADCNLSDWGCGTLGMNNCDGLCVYTNPDPT